MNCPTHGSTRQSVPNARAADSMLTEPRAHGASRIAVQTRYRLWISTPTCISTMR
jgi:hypothetical protein